MTDFLFIDEGANLQISPDDFIGSKVAVLGVAGTGKTNTAARILEQLFRRAIPMTIVDVEGEYWGLKEQFDVLIVGSGEHVDRPMGISEAAAFARVAWSKNLAVILDVSDFDEDERNTFILQYFEALWDAAVHDGKPYLVVLEEAHEWVPQTGGDAEVKKVLARFALRGRKRGIGMVMISQRSAKVAKDVLTQARMAFLHRVYHPTDLKVYQEMLPLKPSEVDAMVGSLQTGQCIFYYENTVRIVQIAKRETYHAGATPGLDQQHAAKLRVVDESLLEELRQLAPPTVDEAVEALGQQADVADLRARLEDLEQQAALIPGLRQQLDAANVTIGHLRRQLEEEQAATSPVGFLPSDRADVRPVSPPVPDVEVTPKGQEREQKRSDLAVRKQTERFNVFLGDLRDLRAASREIVVYLTERPEMKANIKQLCRALGMTFTSLLKNPPTDALDAGLLVRRGVGSEAVWQSSLEQHLTETYPDLDAHELRAKTLARLNALMK